MKKKLALIITVVMIIGLVAATAIACKDPKPTVVESEELVMMMEDNYYFGTEGEVDLATAIPGSNYATTDSNVTIKDGKLTVKSAGDFTLTYTDSENKAVTLKAHAVEGVNTTDWATLVTAVDAQKNVVLQGNVKAPAGSTTVYVKNTTFYGNAKYIDLEEIIKGTASNPGNNGFFVINDSKATFMDLYIYGKVYGEDEQIILENCEGYGAFVYTYSEKDETRPEVNIKHCIFENGHKHVYARGADLTVEGTVMRNGADALLAIETSSIKGAVVNVKNSVFANSVVCGIILCGWNNVRSDADYSTLNLEGFVDIYNWKSRDTAKLMPATEGTILCNTVNKIVQGELGKEKYNSYFSKGSDGTDYVHFGIVQIATGNLKSNNSKVNGLESTGMVQKSFPLPPAASAIVKTCLLYGIDPSNITIQPTATVDDNTSLSYELIHGRVAE